MFRFLFFFSSLSATATHFTLLSKRTVQTGCSISPCSAMYTEAVQCTSFWILVFVAAQRFGSSSFNCHRIRTLCFATRDGLFLYKLFIKRLLRDCYSCNPADIFYQIIRQTWFHFINSLCRRREKSMTALFNAHFPVQITFHSLFFHSSLQFSMSPYSLMIYTSHVFYCLFKS